MQLPQAIAMDRNSNLFVSCAIWFSKTRVLLFWALIFSLFVIVQNRMLPDVDLYVLTDRKLCPGPRGTHLKVEGIYLHSSASC